MGAQKDLISGYNFAPNAEASQEQFEQAINGAAPLSNIGLVFVGTSRPDITNNPRFIRYLWLDITDPDNPVFKRYIEDRTVLVDADGSWEALGVASGAITTAMLAARSTTGGVDIARLKAESDYSDSGDYYFLLRIAANGKDIEAVNLSTALQDGGGVPFSRIETTGIGTAKYLKSVGGALAYGLLDPAVDITSALGNRMPITSLAPGTANYFVIVNAAGTEMEFRSLDNAITDGTLPLDKLDTALASTHDIINYSGSAWVRNPPTLQLTRYTNTTVGGRTYGTDITSFAGAPPTLSESHGLASRPKLIRAVLVCLTGDLGYAVGDEVALENCRDAASNELAFGVASNGTSAIIVCARVDYNAGGNVAIRPFAGGANANVNKARWQVKVYAFA